MSGVCLTFDLKFLVQLHDQRYLASGADNPWTACADSTSGFRESLAAQIREHLEGLATRGERLSMPVMHGPAPMAEERFSFCAVQTSPVVLLRTTLGSESAVARPIRGAEHLDVIVTGVFGFE